MQTLYDRLKPELKETLESNCESYEFSCNKIIRVLKYKTLYCELTIDEVRSLIIWSDPRPQRDDADWKFGDDLFTNTI